jgi:hypothetical protein
MVRKLRNSIRRLGRRVRLIPKSANEAALPAFRLPLVPSSLRYHLPMPPPRPRLRAEQLITDSSSRTGTERARDSYGPVARTFPPREPARGKTTSIDLGRGALVVIGSFIIGFAAIGSMLRSPEPAALFVAAKGQTDTTALGSPALVRVIVNGVERCVGLPCRVNELDPGLHFVWTAVGDAHSTFVERVRLTDGEVAELSVGPSGQMP